MPVLIPLEARDENGDGMIDLTVAPDNDCRNPSSLLNVLWVFEGKPRLDLEQLLQGRSGAAPLAHVACGDNGGGDNGDRLLRSPSVNVVLVRLHNAGDAAVETAPEFALEGPDAAKPGKQDLAIGPWTVTGSEPFAGVRVEHGKATLQFARKPLEPSRERVVAVSLWRDAKADETPRTVAEALALRDRAANYWNQLDLPYDRLQVPDEGIQGVIEASLRSIYQNRDYKNGVPVYQVGPTCYRDLSCADGSFLCELGVLLGRPKDASDTLDHLLSFQCANGRVWVYWDYWKESGLMLWSVVRYAELTGDAAWLKSRWRRVEGMVAFIEELRRRAKQRPAAPNYGLIPAGFGDGGAGVCTEYSNVVWDLVGLRAAVAGARLLGKDEQAAAWQREVDDMDGYFRAAARRDARKDQHGNLYLPNVMGSDGRIPPPRGQWAFVQSIYPGKLYRRDDPLAQGSLAMLEAAQVEGLPLDSGWTRWRGLALLQPLACQRLALDGRRTKIAADPLRRRQPRLPVAGLVGRANAAGEGESARRRHAAQLGFGGVHSPGAVHARDGARQGIAPLRGTSLGLDPPRHGHAHPRRGDGIRPPVARAPRLRRRPTSGSWNWTCRNGFALRGWWCTWTAGPPAPARSICPRKAACGARNRVELRLLSIARTKARHRLSCRLASGFSPSVDQPLPGGRRRVQGIRRPWQFGGDSAGIRAQTAAPAGADRR